MEIFKLFGSIFVNSDEANDSISAVDKNAQKTGKSLGDMIGTAAKWGAAIGAAVGGAAIALGVKGVKAADDFKKAMNGLATETGATEEEMSGLKDIATRIYNNNFGENFEDIAKAMANVKTSTGLAGDELEKATQNALMLRDTFEFDVEGSIQAVDVLMKNFGITADEAYTLIAQGAQNGANKNGDLLDVLNEYTPQFEAMGFSAEEMTNILINGAESGAFSIDKVGDAIKELNIRAKDGSTTTQDAFKSLGLSADTTGAAFARGGEAGKKAFQDVMTALAGVKDPMEQNRIGVELFGTQYEDLGAKGIAALANLDGAANMSADTLAKINETKYDTFGEAITGIGRNFETGLLIPLGEKVLPKLQELSDWVMDHMPEIQAGFSSALDVVTGLFNGLSEAIQWVIDNGNLLIPVITGITAAVVAQMVINGLVKAYKAWQLATAAQTTAQWLLNAALSANPLGIVALAVGALIAAGVLLYKNWDTVKAKLSDLWKHMKDIGGNIKDFFADVFGGLVDGFKWYVNKWISAINYLIKGLNEIQVSIPDWVPKLGGKSFGIHLSTIPMLAKGTDYFGGGLAIVGEQGPELVSMPKGSSVTPNDETEDLLSGKSPEYIQTNLYMDGKAIAAFVSKAQYDNARYKSRSLGGLF